MMDFSIFKKLTVGRIELKQLFINGIQVWKAGYKNWVRYSTESDGVTIYNGGLGYKNGYRIRSGGALDVKDMSSHTGYIPVQPDDIVRISGCDFGRTQVESAINISNADFNNLGQMCMNSTWGYGSLQGTTYGNRDYVVEEIEGVWKWTVPPASYGVAYIRVSAYKSGGGDGASLIVTVNEEIT